eukprot:TRINITY_DN817_c0_g1_i13.p1 TRINITY_DN817_c0_g1~~TRINITY_DN817_c0_g1_i13.p1  ORF type:complete len:168 (+),score=31.34 TRINITY_DN817_c0_g1_i13:757-1260(+)
MLKQLGPRAKEALLHVINLSWQEGSVPQSWRDALTKPLPKPMKDHTDPCNYRPIDLTSNLCKLAERMIKTRLSYMLEDPASNLHKLCHTQAGFQAGRTTIEQIAALTQRLKDGQKKKKITYSIFLDFEKAFDTVQKTKLMEKLTTMNWIGAFLQNRQAAVSLEGGDK